VALVLELRPTDEKWDHDVLVTARPGPDSSRCDDVLQIRLDWKGRMRLGLSVAVLVT
jgi:hypothetical protein